MGLYPSVVIKSETAVPVADRPYLNVALLTFVPSTNTFDTGFKAGAEFVDPGTGDGIAAMLTINNWQSKLTAWGATSDEPIWQNAAAYFGAAGVAPAGQFAEPVTKPPRLYIGARQTAVPTEIELEFTSNTAGTVTVTINKSGQIFSAGHLAQVQVVADGVLTPTQLATALDAALTANAEFSALYNSTATGPVVAIESLADGYPLTIHLSVTTGGPIVTKTTVTANTPGDYYDDLALLQSVAELSDDPVTGKPERRWYWISDLQGDDDVNAEGFEWCQDQQDAVAPSRDYRFRGLSRDTSNFDPLAVSSPAQVAKAANGGTGWQRGGVCFHDLYEWPVAAWMGRVIGYRLGINPANRVLWGSNKYARITPRYQGDNASLAAERSFDYNSIEGTRGAWLWGYEADGDFVDRGWLEDWCTYEATRKLTEFKQVRNLVAFTDPDISAGASVIEAALLSLRPTVLSVAVTFKRRTEIDPVLIAQRTYVDYTVAVASGGAIDRFGVIAQPILIQISESLA